MQFTAMRRNESLIRAPTAGSELLGRGQQRESMLHPGLILRSPFSQIRAARGSKSNSMRVCMLLRKWIGTCGQRIEELAVKHVSMRKLCESRIASKLGRSEKILRHDKGLVVRRVLLANAIPSLCRQERSSPGKHAIQQLRGAWHMTQRGCIQQSDEVLVQR